MGEEEEAEAQDEDTPSTYITIENDLFPPPYLKPDILSRYFKVMNGQISENLEVLSIIEEGRASEDEESGEEE